MLLVQRGSATVVAVVGPGSDGVLSTIGSAARVRVVRVDPALPALERAVLAQQLVGGDGAPVTIHDADPLAAVADAWVARFDGAGAAGDLEVQVGAAVARWRGQALELPDYYVLLDPDAWPPTRRHWYLGVLAAAAPSRVLPAGDATAVAALLARLPTGRWWPTVPRLLEDVDRRVPDALRQPGGTEERALIVGGR
jgi:hypothetical protein